MVCTEARRLRFPCLPFPFVSSPGLPAERRHHPAPEPLSPARPVPAWGRRGEGASSGRRGGRGAVRVGNTTTLERGARAVPVTRRLFLFVTAPRRRYAPPARRAFPLPRDPSRCGRSARTRSPLPSRGSDGAAAPAATSVSPRAPRGALCGTDRPPCTRPKSGLPLFAVRVEARGPDPRLAPEDLVFRHPRLPGPGWGPTLPQTRPAGLTWAGTAWLPRFSRT